MGTSYLVASWGGLVAYPGMSAVSKDTTYKFDALTSQITAQNTPDVCKINVLFKPIQVTLDAVNSAGTHLSGSTFSVHDYASLNPDVNGPYVFTMANGGSSSSLTAAWGEIVFYTDIPNVTKDKTYWFDAITSQLQTDITPGDCKINVVFLPANPLTVVPEYPLGALIALAACFVGFVVFKKHSYLSKLKRNP